MTTEQATQIIAEELSLGSVQSENLKTLKSQAGCYLSEGEYEQWVRRGKKDTFTPKAERYLDIVGKINHQARNWNWTAVSRYIESLYSFLGAAHPVMGGAKHSTGYAYHTGSHPIQAAQCEIEK